MGRGMVDGDVSRRATFGERSGGLLTEAQELAALCEADVGVLIFDSAGRQVDYCSPHTRSVRSFVDLLLLPISWPVRLDSFRL